MLLSLASSRLSLSRAGENAAAGFGVTSGKKGETLLEEEEVEWIGSRCLLLELHMGVTRKGGEEDCGERWQMERSASEGVHSRASLTYTVGHGAQSNVRVKGMRQQLPISCTIVPLATSVVSLVTHREGNGQRF